MVFTIKARTFPTLFYISREIAEEEAINYNAELCYIEYNGYDIGYGLYDTETNRLIDADGWDN